VEGVVAEQERRRPDPQHPVALVGWTQRPSRSRRASSAFTVALLSGAVPAPAGCLAALVGQQPLVGTGGQVPRPGLFGAVSGALLAGLEAGLDGAAGHGGHPVLGGLEVLVPGGAGNSGAEQLDLFAAAGATHCLAWEARASRANPGFNSRNARTRSGRVPRVGTAGAHC
jgi:hypothetical protein